MLLCPLDVSNDASGRFGDEEGRAWVESRYSRFVFSTGVGFGCRMESCLGSALFCAEENLARKVVFVEQAEVMMNVRQNQKSKVCQPAYYQAVR